VPELDLDARVRRACVRLAEGGTRAGFLARAGALMLAAAGVRAGVHAGAAEAPVPGSQPLPSGYYGFCGHTYTTGSCESPLGLPRIDRDGRPLRPSDGRPIDNLGRLVDRAGRPVDETGRRLVGPDGSLLPAGPRTRICEDWVPEHHGIDAVRQGSWYRCCGGQVRRLWDCCSESSRRINGDASLVGYCYGGKHVFCVTYYDTGTPC
jgi:hypothetical protein